MINLHGYGPSILEGALVTIEVGLASLAISMVLGIFGALAKLSASRPLRLVAQIYTTIIRGIPDLVLMLLIFFGGQVFINQMAPLLGYDDYIDINPFIVGPVGSQSAVVVAPDTGPAHIAHALGVPVVGLYGHTNPWRVGPWRRFHDLVIDRYTEPGTPPDPSGYLPKEGRMEAIEVEAVVHKVERARERYA